MIDWNSVNPIGLAIFMIAGILLMIFPRFMMAPFLKLFRTVKPVIMKPVKEELPDWSAAPEWAKYVAQDISGEWRWHDKKPKLAPEGFWVSTAPTAASRAGYTAVENESYKSSITKRP